MHKAGSYAYLPLERVVFGRPAAEAAVEEAARVGATRVFIVASKSLARNTPVIRTIADALGARYVGLFDGCVQHSPRASVIAAARAVRAAKPDLILTVGGGTALDTVKVLQICLAHDVDSTEALDGLHALDRARRQADRAGHQALAGAPGRRADDALRRRVLKPCRSDRRTYPPEAFVHRCRCRSACGDPRPRGDGPYAANGCGSRPACAASIMRWKHSARSTRILIATVSRCTPCGCLRKRCRTPTISPRGSTCQEASWLAASSIARIDYGASHGIGHALGAFADVPHGHTSCVMLPHVMRYNERATAAKQRLIAEAMGRPGVRGSRCDCRTDCGAQAAGDAARASVSNASNCRKSPKRRCTISGCATIRSRSARPTT